LIKADQIKWDIHVYELIQTQQPSKNTEQTSGGSGNHREWIMPNVEMDGIWESLVLPGQNHRLLKYVQTGFLLDSMNVDPSLITWNR
jgi:hypothetical protein